MQTYQPVEYAERNKYLYLLDIIINKKGVFICADLQMIKAIYPIKKSL